MITVTAVFFNDDDHEVNVSTFPCDNMETAKVLSEKIYEKCIKKFGFENDKEREAWESNKFNVRRDDNRIFISGYECGYAEIVIQDEEPLTTESLKSYEFKIYSF